jgi:hypothetical protein
MESCGPMCKFRRDSELIVTLYDDSEKKYSAGGLCECG